MVKMKAKVKSSEEKNPVRKKDLKNYDPKIRSPKPHEVRSENSMEFLIDCSIPGDPGH